MTRRCERSGAVMIGMLFLSVLHAFAQKSEAPFPEGLAKKVLENDLVVAWDITWEKGKSTGMRKLDMDQVTVTLADGAKKITKPNGAWGIEEKRFGSVRFESKGTVVEEEGVSEIPSHEVVFQLKDRVADPWPVREGVPGQFPRINTVKLFETDRIAIWDQVWKPGVQVAHHSHYHPTATVFLVGGSLHAIPDNGAPSTTFPRKAGEVISSNKFSTSGHVEEEAEGLPRAIWIEFTK